MAFFKIKVIMLGSAEAGKNHMCRKYFEGLNAVYQKNIGVEIYSRTFQLPSNEDVNISFWNCSADSKYSFHMTTFCRGSAGAFIWFDITDRDSYLETIKWANYVKLAGKIPIVLIGNKVDQASNRKVSFEEAKAFSEENGFLAYIETSVEKNVNVLESIRLLTDIILYYRIEKGQQVFNADELTPDLMASVDEFSF